MSNRRDCYSGMAVNLIPTWANFYSRSTKKGIKPKAFDGGCKMAATPQVELCKGEGICVSVTPGEGRILLTNGIARDLFKNPTHQFITLYLPLSGEGGPSATPRA